MARKFIWAITMTFTRRRRQRRRLARHRTGFTGRGGGYDSRNIAQSAVFLTISAGAYHQFLPVPDGPRRPQPDNRIPASYSMLNFDPPQPAS